MDFDHLRPENPYSHPDLNPIAEGWTAYEEALTAYAKATEPVLQALYEALEATLTALRQGRDNNAEGWVTPGIAKAWDSSKQALALAEGKERV